MPLFSDLWPALRSELRERRLWSVAEEHEVEVWLYAVERSFPALWGMLNRGGGLFVHRVLAKWGPEGRLSVLQGWPD